MKPELLAPAGNMTMLRTAVDAGADSVYFGLKELNMRMKARNFDQGQLAKSVSYCHSHGVKVYVTLNTIVYDDELSKLAKILKAIKKAKADAVICWDPAVMQGAKAHSVPIHISTQASVANSAAAKHYKELGAKRIVLARECSLEQIAEIKKTTSLEIEAFIHGAMCVSISGRCFLSHHLYGKSANRGECIQPCRRIYKVKDIEEGRELGVGEDYILSAKDLCTLPIIDRILDTGIDSLKIEGRNKSPEYVKTVVESYRTAVDAWAEGKLTPNLKEQLLRHVEQVYNRGFSTGFYIGLPSGRDYAGEYGSRALKLKKYSGCVTNYYSKIGVAEVHIRSRPIKVGDEVLIMGDKTGTLQGIVHAMQHQNKQVDASEKGWHIGIKVQRKVRKNDKVFVLIKREGKS